MTRSEYKNLLTLDKERFQGFVGSTSISWWVTSSYRRGQYLYSKSNNPVYKALFRLFQVYYYFVKLITGIQLPVQTQIGGGLLFPHYSLIVFAGAVRIGKSCTIHQGCTIGMSHFGKKKGAPVIGDNVVIYSNVNITGNIHIGNNVIIGANSVVTHDVPDNCVVVGAPARIVSTDSSSALGDEGRALYWRAK